MTTLPGASAELDKLTNESPASETDADILYPTRFFAPDPFLFVLARGRRVLVMSDLEMDRAKKQARVDEVMSWSRLARAEEAAGGKATPAAAIPSGC